MLPQPPRFFEVKILETRKEALDIMVLKVEKPAEFDFKAGQYCMIALNAGNKEEVKPFSIACSPSWDYLEFATKNTGSEFKKAWEKLEAGDRIAISRARGTFVFDENYKNICMLSGGIGITPLRNMLQYAIQLFYEKELDNRITLLYSNKVPEDIAFREELLGFAKRHSGIKIVLTITRPEESKMQWQGKTGRIDASMIKEFAANADAYYICGPPSMVEGMQQTLLEMGIPQEKIKSEKFAGYK